MTTEPNGYRKEIPHDTFVALPDAEQRAILHAMQEMAENRLKEMQTSGNEVTIGGKTRLTNFSAAQQPIDKTLDAIIANPTERSDAAYRMYAQGRYALGATDPNPPEDFIHLDMSRNKPGKREQQSGSSQDANIREAEGERQRFRDLSAEEKVTWLQQRQQKIARWAENPRFKETLSKNPELAEKIEAFKKCAFKGMDEQSLRKERKEFLEIRESLGLGHRNHRRNPSAETDNADMASARQIRGSEQRQRENEEGGAERNTRRTNFSQEGREGRRQHREERMAQQEQRFTGFQERLERRVERMGGIAAIQEKNPDLSQKIQRLEQIKPSDLAAMSREERKEVRELRHEVRDALGMGRRGRERGEDFDQQSRAPADGQREFQGYGRDRRPHMEEGGEISYPRIGRQEWRVGEPSDLRSQEFAPAVRNQPPDGNPEYHPGTPPDPYRHPASPAPSPAGWNDR